MIPRLKRATASSSHFERQHAAVRSEVFHVNLFLAVETVITGYLLYLNFEGPHAAVRSEGFRIEALLHLISDFEHCLV